MIRVVALALAAALMAGCAVNAGPRASTPASFVGYELAQMSAVYGAPTRLSYQDDGAAIASFTVADARTAPTGPQYSTPRQQQPLIPTGRRPQILSSGPGAGGDPSLPTRYRQCVINAVVNAEGQVTAVEASSSLCNHITRP